MTKRAVDAPPAALEWRSAELRYGATDLLRTHSLTSLAATGRLC
jgi:hypothetical protein